jgi:O-antigen/teichoic acid export membrane protein
MTDTPATAQPVSIDASSVDAAEAKKPNDLQRASRHTIVYGIGFLLNRVVGLAMLPVYTRFLTPADYGVLQLIELTFEVVMIIAGARLSSGVFHFFHKAKTAREQSAVLGTTFVMMVGAYVLVTTVAFASAPAISQVVFRTPARADLIRIAAVGLAFQSLLLVPIADLQVRERSTRYVFANSTKLLIQLTLNIITLVVLKMGVRGMLISTVVGNTVVGAWLAITMLREVGVVWSWPMARAVFTFSMPLVAMQFATFVSTYGDRFFLQRSFPVALEGDSAVGIYGLAYQFGFLLNTLAFYPFYNAWEPMRFDVAKRPDRDAVYARSFVYFNMFYITVGLFMSLMVLDFLRIMTTPAFVSAAAMAPVIMLAYVFQGWTDIQNLGLFITERTGLLSLANWVAAGVAVLGYVLLIPRYHGMGAAVATLFSFVVRHVLVLVMAQRLWPVRYEWAPVVKLLVLACATVAASTFLPRMSIPLSILTRSGLFALFVAAAVSSGIVSDDDRVLLKKLVRSPRAAVAQIKASMLTTSG